jgi:predicted  nucleic acid-binding Zn-ribbon protein
LIAAAAGCGVGVGTNRYVQTKRTQYANNEVRLQSMIQDVRADNARLRRVVGSAQEVVDEDRRRIEAIDRAYAQRRISLAEARAQMAAVDNNRAYLEQTLANLKQREREWRRVADQERHRSPGAAMAAMDQEIDRLQKHIASLEYELKILVDRRSISPVG